MSTARSHLLVPMLVLALAARASALSIVIDYSFDVANGNYFGTHPIARAALEKAAGDLGAELTTALGAVSTDVFTATSGTATVKFDWDLGFPNPANNNQVNQTSLNIAANTVVIHAGFRALTSGLLGGSSVAVATPLPTVNPPGTVMDRGMATTAATNASNAMIPRGNAPVMGSTIGNFGAAYHLSYGPFGGSIWFQGDTGSAPLDEYWHFDAAQPVAAGKYDFYSVAVREITHALGFGTSEAWRAQISPDNATTWIGPKVDALFGGDGTNLITSDGQIAAGLSGRSLFDGSEQIAALAPGLATGSRRYLTTLDTAYLQDFGYQVVPEPRGALLLAVGGAMLAATRPRRRFRLV